MNPPDAEEPQLIAKNAWRRYAELVASPSQAAAWWTVVVITASSRRQADRYEWEIQRRRDQGKLPAGVRFLAIPDPQDRRVGSGAATIHALQTLGALEAHWWADQRVLLIHSGGDSRRLPIYSISGKLFSAVPVRTPWGELSTVFDEWMALSTLWVEHFDSGLLVGSGDVILTFDSEKLDWNRKGVCGVALRQPIEIGTQHGVYIADEQGRVHSFLQKPSREEVRAAGGILSGDNVALDSGLIRFCPESAARLARVPSNSQTPPIDLYQHITMALSGQWRPKSTDPEPYQAIAAALNGIPFWVNTLDGQFTHIGTTRLFQRLMTEETEFSRLYAEQQHSRLNVIDSVLATGSEVAPGALVMECNLRHPLRAARGSVLLGMEAIEQPTEVPEDTVVHQSPVATEDGGRGVVIRVYGLNDDPKVSVLSEKATWLGRPFLDELQTLGITLEEVWPGIEDHDERTLWNAALFPIGSVQEAWNCARWLMRLTTDYPLDRWRRSHRLSLATAARWADMSGVADAHARRAQANWERIAVELACSGADIRPLLNHPPSVSALVRVGQGLEAAAEECDATAATEAASRSFQASLFQARAGLTERAERSREQAFHLVRQAVDVGISDWQSGVNVKAWRHRDVQVTGPARIDLGGGWSDTPPFCLDWGGSVLNVSVELNRVRPISTKIQVLDEPVIRCWSDESQSMIEYTDTQALLAPPRPGDPYAIPRAALGMCGLFEAGQSLRQVLESLGGGLEIRTRVDLPMGSGLGTSSILAATTLRALFAMLGIDSNDQSLSDGVMRLEQWMTTGGGWQDQAGGIFAGAKLILSGPGNRQRLRVQPLALTAERQAQFEQRLVLYFTGIRRVARNLLQTVVGRYLARETAAVQVLHSIKTLAVEMGYALQEGDWPYLGSLLDRHWRLNQELDPATTNAPISALLDRARPHILGAKLAGAGGGGFLMLLAKEGAVEALQHELGGIGGPGAVYDWRVAARGMAVGYN